VVPERTVIIQGTFEKLIWCEPGLQNVERLPCEIWLAVKKLVQAIDLRQKQRRIMKAV
jgi:hypothetical protein